MFYFKSLKSAKIQKIRICGNNVENVETQRARLYNETISVMPVGANNYSPLCRDVPWRVSTATRMPKCQCFSP